MPGPVGEKQIQVKGLRELQRAFTVYNRSMGKDFREAFLAAGQPVADTASRLATESISHIRIPWSSMRVGFSKRIVWVAPVARGRRGRGARITEARRQANLTFAGRLLDEAMIPAVDQNIGRVEQELEDQLDELAKAWARV